MTGPPPAAYAGALAGLPGMGPAALHALLAEASPGDVWDAVRRGEVIRPAPRGASPAGAAQRVAWADAAARAPVAEWWHAWVSKGIRVSWAGDASYPERLRNDPEPPGVLFWRGSLDGLAGPCVAVVGTRRCSPDGRASAYDLGRDLAAAGVCVVSGLALGIDGAAHLGALGAPPAATGTGGPTVGVAASGVDVPYPARHAVLWERVASAGAVVSETPPGRPAQAWRFPARNRVIAGVVDLVVVVESHTTGGSLITADKAIARGIEVRVVPGPVHSPAAAGSNQLLYDGPGPVRDATDVLDALGLLAIRPQRLGRRRRVPRADQLTLRPAAAEPGGAGPAPQQGPLRRAVGGLGAPVGRLRDEPRAVLEAVGWRPTSLNRVVDRCGLAVASVGRALDELRAAGLVTEERGWWTRT